MSAAILELVGFGIYWALFGPSPELPALESCPISRAEPEGAPVRSRWVDDSGWTPFGESSATIVVIYDVEEGSSREQIVDELLSAAATNR